MSEFDERLKKGVDAHGSPWEDGYSVLSLDEYDIYSDGESLLIYDTSYGENEEFLAYQSGKAKPGHGSMDAPIDRLNTDQKVDIRNELARMDEIKQFSEKMIQSIDTHGEDLHNGFKVLELNNGFLASSNGEHLQIYRDGLGGELQFNSGKGILIDDIGQGGRRGFDHTLRFYEDGIAEGLHLQTFESNLYDALDSKGVQILGVPDPYSRTLNVGEYTISKDSQGVYVDSADARLYENTDFSFVDDISVVQRAELNAAISPTVTKDKGIFSEYVPEGYTQITLEFKGNSTEDVQKALSWATTEARAQGQGDYAQSLQQLGDQVALGQSFSDIKKGLGQTGVVHPAPSLAEQKAHEIANRLVETGKAIRQGEVNEALRPVQVSAQIVESQNVDGWPAKSLRTTIDGVASQIEIGYTEPGQEPHYYYAEPSVIQAMAGTKRYQELMAFNTGKNTDYIALPALGNGNEYDTHSIVDAAQGEMVKLAGEYGIEGSQAIDFWDSAVGNAQESIHPELNGLKNTAVTARDFQREIRAESVKVQQSLEQSNNKFFHDRMKNAARIHGHKIPDSYGGAAMYTLEMGQDNHYMLTVAGDKVSLREGAEVLYAKDSTQIGTTSGIDKLASTDKRDIKRLSLSVGKQKIAASRAQRQGPPPIKVGAPPIQEVGAKSSKRGIGR